MKYLNQSLRLLKHVSKNFFFSKFNFNNVYIGERRVIRSSHVILKNRVIPSPSRSGEIGLLCPLMIWLSKDLRKYIGIGLSLSPQDHHPILIWVYPTLTAISPTPNLTRFKASSFSTCIFQVIFNNQTSRTNGLQVNSP